MSDAAVKMICDMLEHIAPGVIFLVVIYLFYKSQR